MGKLACRIDAQREWRQRTRILQWIGGGDKPPDAIKVQAP
jgi:hypothetical protein